MTKNLSKLTGLFVLSLLLCVAQLFAQSTTTGGISGSVTDPQGGVVPNATVTVTNIATNAAVTAVTNTDGGYRVTNLQPGTYKVETAVSGFAPALADNIVVEVGRSTPVDIPLTLGSATAEVEVTAEAPVVNVTDNANASNFDQTQINELPINGRRWSNFALLSPSAVPDGTFGLISFRGISGLLNNNTIDGGDNNQAFFSEERGRTRINYSISQASIREFQVNTSNYSAEYGRSAGGVTNAVTKSGTNEFHGEVFYYNRNNRNGARNPLQFVPTLSGVQQAVKPPDLREQFGGNIGGPIVKDKLFFFFNYDQQRRNFPGVARFTQASFLSFTNVGTPPVNQRTLLNNAGVTDAHINSAFAYLIDQTGLVPRKGDQTLYFPKVDWQINSKNLFTASYNRLRWESPNGVQTQATNTRSRTNFGDDFVEIDSFNARLQTSINANWINEFRFQYGRDFESQFSTAPGPNEPATAFGGTRSPNIFITNGLEMGTPTFLERGKFPDERRYQFADTMTYIRGRHTLKFGADINKVTDDISNLRFEAGAYSYTGTNALPDFIMDYTNWRNPGLLPTTTLCLQQTGATGRRVGRCYASNYQQGIGSEGIKLGTWDYNFFFQDDIRLSPRLTANIGLRYEYISMPGNQLTNTNSTGNGILGSMVLPNDGRTVTEATSTLPDDNNNFGPRVGFAYDLTGDGKTSLRAGYGIYYGRIQSSTIYNALVNTGNPGGQGQYQVAGNVTTPTTANPVAAPIFPNIIDVSTVVVGATPTAIQFFSSNFNAPLINQYDIVFEREVMKNTAVSVSYIGSLGRSLPTFYDINWEQNPTAPTTTYSFTNGPYAGQFMTLPNYRRVPGIPAQPMTRIQSTVKSEYNALVVQFNRRFTDGLQVLASYTLASSTDTDQNSATFTETSSPYDIFNGSYDRGPSSFDTRHKVVISGVWAPTFFKGGQNTWQNYLLNGWSLAPNFNYYSGRPFNPNVSGTSLNGQNGDTFLPLAGRNSFRLPALMNMDLRLSKRFKFRETMALEFIAEGFNIFNRTHVFAVNNTFYSRSGTVLTYNAAFGQITGTDSTLYRERQIQFATRFQF